MELSQMADEDGTVHVNVL